MNPESVAAVAKDLYDAGCYEVCLSDTIGVGTPGYTAAMFQAVNKVLAAVHGTWS